MRDGETSEETTSVAADVDAELQQMNAIEPPSAQPVSTRSPCGLKANLGLMNHRLAHRFAGEWIGRSREIAPAIRRFGP